MSGTTTTSFLSNISSASGVVGPFAISRMNLALTSCALFLVKTFSKAAGTNISTSRINNSFPEIFLAPSKLATLLVFFLCSKSF